MEGARFGARLGTRLRAHPTRDVAYLDPTGAPARCSFGELADMGEALGSHLAAQGVGGGWRVGLVGPNSPDWLVWDLALIGLGCTVVSIPEEVLAEHGDGIFETFDLRFLVRARTAALALAHHVHACEMESRTPAVRAREASGALPFPVPDVCALAFSSGASGRPKCLMINMRGIEWDIAHYVPEFELRAADRLLVFLPLTLQQQRLLLYAAYWHGISIVLGTPERLFDVLSTLRPTLCLAPPLLYEGLHERFLGALEEMPPRTRSVVDALRALAKRVPRPLAAPIRRLLFRRVYAALGGEMRVMLTGMAPIRRAALEFFEELDIPLFEAYGLTETGVIASNTPASRRLGSVGRPVEGSTIVLGEDGEVLVKREQFASFGYLDEHGTEPLFAAGQLMPTGDIGRFDTDGFLYLVGRKKEIIVTSQGTKIHPERIEAGLNLDPLVRQSVVLGDGQKALVAVVAVRKPKTAEVAAAVEAAVARLNASLDDSARIGKVVVTEEPFTLANGLLTRSLKLNRRAIADRFSRELFGRTAVYDEPTAEELAEVDADVLAAVREAWHEVLGKKQLPLKAPFFDLGGDSLSAMRTVSHLQERLSTQITIRDIFVEPTILGVARALTAERRANTRGAVALEEGSI